MQRCSASKKGLAYLPLVKSAGAVLFLVSLGACTNNQIELPNVEVPNMKVTLPDVDTSSPLAGEIIEGDYIAAYSKIARGLRQCWLKEGTPLSKTQFFARNKTTGAEKKSDIFIHKPAQAPKRGPRIFSIHLKPEGKGTKIHLDNRSLAAKTEANVTKDIRAWVKGSQGCIDHKAEEGQEKAEVKTSEKKNIPLPNKKVAP